MITPHPYQSDYLKAIAEKQKDFKRNLVVSPTGSGKGNLFCWEIERFAKAGVRSLLLVDQNELIHQPIKRLREITGLHAEAEQSQWRASRDCGVVVASVQTMMRRYESWPRNHFGNIICDEADRSIAPSWQSVLKHFDEHAFVTGFTATPHRTDRKNLGCYYENSIELENIISLINKGYLSPIKVHEMPVKIDLSSLSNRGSDYDENELDEIITPHLMECAKAIRDMAAFRYTLVFLPLIKTCKKFDEICKIIGLNSDYVYGDDPNRDAKLRRFKNREIDVMSNSMVWGRGVDIPIIDAICILRPTKSISLIQQFAGRGTRLASGKSDLLILDPLYISLKRMVCRPAHLIAKDDEEVEAITKLLNAPGMPGDVASQLDLLSVAADASSQREAALRKQLEENKDKAARTVSAAEFAMKYNSLTTAEFEPTMTWESKPVTDKQKKYLEQAGIDLATVNGTGHASSLLEIYFKHKPLKMASFEQRKIMRRMGCPNWESATQPEAVKFFASLKHKPKVKEASFL